jgi:hypothetical protein
MSTHLIEKSTTRTRESSAEARGSAVRGALIGLIPLELLAGVVLVAIVVTALARDLADDGGFFVQQQTALIILIVDLVLAIVVFALAVWRVVRQIAAWQRTGVAMQANAALWALGATALVIVVPVLLAGLLPQHPFP